MRNRLPSKVLCTVLATVVLVAGAAQGLMFMRCGAAVVMAASCCCHEGETTPLAAQVVPGAGDCCERVMVPAAQPQAERSSGAPVAARIAVAIVAEPLPFIGALHRAPQAPRLDPPPGPSPLLASCSLLI